MKILVDMNLSPMWAPFLVAAGFEAEHWSRVGRPTAADSIIMDYAAENGYVVLTHDLDFGALLAVRAARRPSVLQIRAQDILPEAMGELVLRALRAYGVHLESGALVTVEPGRNRVRLLPI